MAKSKPTLVDLFAGCGGVALGFHDAGFETLFANEMHPDPADTYRKNLLVGKEERMIVGPMQKFLQNKHIDQLGIKPFEVDCVAGGPPCQGFSSAGNGHYDLLAGGTVTQWYARETATVVWDRVRIDDWEDHILTTLVTILPTPS